MQRQWRIIPHDGDRVELLMRSARRSARLPAVVAQLLVSRGVYNAEDAARFLDSKLKGLRDPQDLPGIHVATELLAEAIEAKTPIIIYGDYDCDGMTGTAILVNGLRLLGADVGYHVPNRLEDGYGLNEAAIRKFSKRGKKLIVTVDCGITSLSHAKLCKELGIKLIITDHHTIGDSVPEADAVVHPRLPGTWNSLSIRRTVWCRRRLQTGLGAVPKNQWGQEGYRADATVPDAVTFVGGDRNSRRCGSAVGRKSSFG